MSNYGRYVANRDDEKEGGLNYDDFYICKKKLTTAAHVGFFDSQRVNNVDEKMFYVIKEMYRIVFTLYFELFPPFPHRHSRFIQRYIGQISGK